MLHVKKLRQEAIIPTRGSDHAVGYDLTTIENTIIPANGKALISTGLAMNIPLGHYGRLAPRSGMSWKYHTDIGAGVIDPDYRGEIKILMFNHSDKELEIPMGTRAAQLILEKCSILDIVEINELDETVRGIGGFGSTS